MATDPRFPSSRFAVGDTVWTLDGVPGRVTDIFFSEPNGFWLVDTTQVDGFIREDELLDFDPRPDQDPLDFEQGERPREDAGAFVTQGDLTLLVLDVRRLAAHFESFVSEGLSDVLAAEREQILQINAELDASQLTALRDGLETEFAAGLADQRTQFADMLSVVTTELSEIRNRLDQSALETQETTGLSPTQFLIEIGRFIKDPFHWWIDRAADSIIQEITDGLNR